MNKNLRKILTWTPRILMILFIGFLSLFSLDVFSEDWSIQEKIVGFFMHNLPALILLLLLIVSWKREKIGGIIFLIMGICFFFAFDAYESIPAFFFVSFPLLLIGGMMLVGSHYKEL